MGNTQEQGGRSNRGYSSSHSQPFRGCMQPTLPGFVEIKTLLSLCEPFKDSQVLSKQVKVFFLRAILYKHKGRYEEAFKEFCKAIRIKGVRLFHQD